MRIDELIPVRRDVNYEMALGYVRQRVAKLHSNEPMPFFHLVFRAAEDAGLISDIDDLDNFLLDLGIQERIATDVRYLMQKNACDIINGYPIAFTEPQLAVIRTALIQALRAIEK